MKRTYKLSTQQLTTQGPCKAVITNKRGSYFVIDKESSYQGWTILQQNKWRALKTIEELRPENVGKCTELIHQGYNIQRKFENGAKDVFLLHNDSLLYSQIGIPKLTIILDHREPYEESKLGRIYSLKEDGEKLIIHFRKKQNNNEEQSPNNNVSESKINDDEKPVKDNEEYDHYICIKGFKKANLLGEWKEKHYAHDKERYSRDTYWVYEAVQIEPKNNLVFSQAETEEKARTLADVAYANFEEILEEHYENYSREQIEFNTKDKREHMATSMAANAFHELISVIGQENTTHAIFAGYPWYFQIWSRDELISLGGLITLAKKKYFTTTDEKQSLKYTGNRGTNIIQTRNKKKKIHYPDHKLLHKIATILKRQVQGIQANGLLENRYPPTQTESIDSIGWLAKRTIDFITLLKEEKHLYNFYSINELLYWKQQLQKALKKIKERRQDENKLIRNNPQETWMDSKYHDNGREGYRIEIQTLFLQLYEAILLLDSVTNKELQKNKDFINEKKAVEKNIKQHYLKTKIIDSKKKTILLDGIEFNGNEDATLRPNIFLALYLAPKIFTKKERKQILQSTLEALYLQWGGLSTIDKQHPLFQPKHTGNFVASYHRGDSWYFINNIAGIVLLREGKEYEQYYEQLFKASTKDILEQGYAGAHSELSSAMQQDANGSFSQAWSASTYIEFADELYPDEE